MAIVENGPERVKFTDHDGDSLFTHGIEPDGSLVITCHDGDTDEYAGVHLSPDEVAALISWILPIQGAIQ